MSVEREVKLAAAAGFRLPDLDGAADGLVAVFEEPRRIHTWYYDTPDLRIARWGCSLRYREGQGWTVKLPSTGDGTLLERPEHPFSGGRKRPPDEAVDLLLGFVRGAELRPVAHLRTARGRVELRTARGEVLGEVVDDEVSILDGRRVAGRFREVEVEIADATSLDVLEGVLGRLQSAGAGPVTNTPKHLRALGPRAEEPPEVAPADGAPESVGDVVRNALAESTIRLLRHDAGVRLGEDPENVHQARVATRRLRSDLRTFRGFLDPDWSSSLRDELKWIGGELGAVRDADVMLGRLRRDAERLPLEDQPRAIGLFDRLDRTRGEVRDRLLSAMRQRRYADLLERLVAAAQQPSVNDSASVPASEALSGVMSGPWQRLRDAARPLDEDRSDEDLHALRIRAKRARYAAEALAPVFGKRARSFAKAAARLQDVLGDHQDAVVAQRWLRDAARGGRRLAYVAGELSVLERESASATREAWPRAWKALSRKRLRFWT
jgi:CHAD domain-containing protein